MSRTVVGIPEPRPDLSSLYETIVALREQVQLLTGQRGDDLERAVTFQDMVDYDFMRTSFGTDWAKTPVVRPEEESPYDLMIFLAGTLDASELAWRGVVLRDFKVQSDAYGSRASAAVAATGSPALLVKKNGSTVLTITFSGSTGTFAATAEVTFVAGDVITLEAPASPDATLADVSICIHGEKL